MTLLAYALWPGLAASVLLGLGVGALTGLPRGRAALAGAGLVAIAAAVLASLAILRTVPGSAGLMIESAALMLGAYLAGCLMGGLGRTLVR